MEELLKDFMLGLRATQILEMFKGVLTPEHLQKMSDNFYQNAAHVRVDMNLETGKLMFEYKAKDEVVRVYKLEHGNSTEEES